jgi:hypothetical protein
MFQKDIPNEKLNVLYLIIGTSDIFRLKRISKIIFGTPLAHLTGSLFDI